MRRDGTREDFSEQGLLKYWPRMVSWSVTLRDLPPVFHSSLPDPWRQEGGTGLRYSECRRLRNTEGGLFGKTVLTSTVTWNHCDNRVNWEDENPTIPEWNHQSETHWVVGSYRRNWAVSSEVYQRNDFENNKLGGLNFRQRMIRGPTICTWKYYFQRHIFKSCNI